MSPRVALVTGAAGGIGNAVAERLGADGWVVAAADTAAVSSVAGSIHGYALDVRHSDEVRAVVSTIVDRFGGLDAVVNCAGTGGPTSGALTVGVDEFRTVFDINVLGTFLVSQAAAKAMIRLRRPGRIINMGSVFGQQAVPDGIAYCASKGAITLLSQSLSLELAPEAITVNTIAPGYIWTPMHEKEITLRAERDNISFDDERRAIRSSIPLQRHGTGADIAGAVCWLLSSDADYVTGQTISVNGGVFLT